MMTVKMNADMINTGPSSSGIAAMAANEPVQALDATTIPDVLNGLLDAWNDVRAVRQALDSVTDQCVCDALCDARNEAHEHFAEAVNVARTMTVADDGCATCHLLGEAVERVVRAHALCEELWEFSAYRIVGENPAEEVLNDALCAARDVLTLAERLGNASKPAA